MLKDIKHFRLMVTLKSGLLCQ